MHRGVWSDRFDERFVPVASREMKSDLPRKAIACISEGKTYTSYRGLPMAKEPFDLVLYQMLFYELQPRVVIELGSYTGASALWTAYTLQTFGVDLRVLSVDIDLSLVDEAARQHPRAKYIQGDCNCIEELLTPAFLSDLPHPIVLIDDAHVHINGVYRHFHEHAFVSGDYLIIEDTIPWIPASFGQCASDDEWSDWNSQQIQKFFAGHQAQYGVDRYYTDFFGYNGTWNWNGFVRRM